MDTGDAELVDLLRADLTAASFTVDALDRLWGEDAAAALHRGHRVPALRALTRATIGETSLATLARIFVLGIPVDAAALDAALPTLTTDGAVALDLVVREGPRSTGDVVRPRLDLRPYSAVDSAGVVSWWIASDLGELALGGPIPEEHVLGVGGASTTLSGLMIPMAAGSVLDLGTGCGIQALHAARQASRVVATDISERALQLAALNAALNRVELDLRLGSLFDPVVGERFDHIVSNPPFVITPRVQGVPSYEYRDGGMIGDGIVEAVIRGARDHLSDGGVAQLLGNWEYRNGEDGLARVERWCEGMDAWVIERDQQSVEQYAETWIRDGGTRPGAEFDRLYAAWLDDFAARGVTSIGFGYVTLRRRPNGRSTCLARFERLDGPVGGSLGEHLAASLVAHDWLESHDLLTSRLTVAADVTEERHYWPGDEHPAAITLRQGAGFQRQVPCGTALAAVVGACDGSLTVGAICEAVADLLEVDAAELTAEVVPQVRELVFTGFLSEPQGDAS
jgi:methylase of polypeptide subunit release factors